MQHPTSSYTHYLAASRTGLRLNIRLGSPRYDNCSSLGICEVMLDRELTRCGCPDLVTAYARIDVPTGRLLLHIDTATLSAELRERHFPPGGFSIEEDYVLSPSVCEALWLEFNSYRITTGTYPPLEDDGLIILSLRLLPTLYLTSTNSHRLAA